MKHMKLIVPFVGLFLFTQAAQAQWEPAARLTWNSGASNAPRVAVDSSGGVHLVWYDDTPGNNEIYYKTSADGGGVWGANRRLTFNSGSSLSPDIAADSADRFHVVWTDNTYTGFDIYYKRSTDGGASWSAKKRLSFDSDPSWTPAVAAGPSNNIHVVWTDYAPGNYEVYYKKSADGGATWSASQRLTWTAGDNQSPSLAVAPSGHIYAAWCDMTPGNFEVYYKKSTDQGVTWSASKRLTWNSGESPSASILADGSGNLHVVWSDGTPGNSEIFYKKSTNGGASWSPSLRLTSNSGQSLSPSICSDANAYLHLVWHDLSPGNAEIYYRKSTNGGTTWTAAQRLSWNSGDSRSANVAAFGSDNYHVVWADDTPGAYEIFYRRQK
jgi:hypothetical protein